MNRLSFLAAAFVLVTFSSGKALAQELLLGSVSYHIEYYDKEGNKTDTTDLTICSDNVDLAIRYDSKGTHSTIFYKRGKKNFTICTNKGGSPIGFKETLIEEADEGALPLGWEKLIAQSRKTSNLKSMGGVTATEYQIESEMFSFNTWVSDSLSYGVESFFAPGSSGSIKADKILMGAFGIKKFILEGTLINNETGDKAIIQLKELKLGKPDPQVFSTSEYYMLEMDR